MEEWVPIPEFPQYLVSDEGFVRHRQTRKELTCGLNNTGAAFVSFWNEGKSYNRSLPLIVANAFLPDPPLPTFDTPINLNGNRMDNRAVNLAWRPRWFARRYYQQFHNNLRGFKVPVEIVETGEIFSNSWEAALRYGLIDRQILLATMDGKCVWPTGHHFRPLRTPHQPA